MNAATFFKKNYQGTALKSKVAPIGRGIKHGANNICGDCGDDDCGAADSR